MMAASQRKPGAARLDDPQFNIEGTDMRLLHVHHRSEWLPQDFDLPPQLKGVKKLFVSSVQSAKDLGLVALQFGPARAAGIWDESGKLLLFPTDAFDLAFLPGGKEVLVLAPGFGKCADGNAGRPSTLRRLELQTWNCVAKAEICVPTTVGQQIVIDPKGERGLVTWHEQNEWGYVTVDLHLQKLLPPTFEWNTDTMSRPAFSPDGKLVVSCNLHQEVWWAGDDGDWTDPSPGGMQKVSTITVHDLASNQVSQHELFVAVDAGWLPDRPEEIEWQQIWGPEFVSDREFRIWLPDESEEILTLPLPPRIEIGRPLKKTREWSE
jgi:hypothetical protein